MGAAVGNEGGGVGKPAASAAGPNAAKVARVRARRVLMLRGDCGWRCGGAATRRVRLRAMSLDHQYGAQPFFVQRLRRAAAATCAVPEDFADARMGLPRVEAPFLKLG